MYGSVAYVLRCIISISQGKIVINACVFLERGLFYSTARLYFHVLLFLSCCLWKALCLCEITPYRCVKDQYTTNKSNYAVGWFHWLALNVFMTSGTKQDNSLALLYSFWLYYIVGYGCILPLSFRVTSVALNQLYGCHNAWGEPCRMK